MTDPFAGLLLELALKSSVLLAIAFVVTALAKRQSSEERHVIWAFALVGLLALPVASIVGPTVELPVQVLVTGAKTAAHSTNLGATTTSASARGVTNLSAIAAAEKSAVQNTFDDHAGGPLAAAIGVLSVDAAVLATTVYGTVALSLLAWFGLASLGVALTLRKLAPVTDASVLMLLKEIRLRRGIRRDVRLRESRSDCTPWAWGVLRPVVVLPDGFARLPAESRRNAIEHDISHIARLDFLTAILGFICCALYWYQPLAWLALRRMTRESERACDDRVLLAGSCRTTYAAQLLDIARVIHFNGRRPILITAMARPSAISQRIASILDLDIRRRTVSKKKTLTILVLTLALVMPIAALKTQAAANPEVEVPDLADSEFQTSLQKGPADSDELALIVKTYAANDRPTDAIDVLVDYISRESKNPDATTPDVTCRFCGSILKSEAFGNERSDLLPMLLSAFDEVERRARATNDGDLFLRLAAISGASGSDIPMQRGTYYLLEGFRIGDLSDQSKLAAVVFLNDMGWFPQAMKLAGQLHNDEESSLYQSDATKVWIDRLNRRIDLSNDIYTRLVTPGVTTVIDGDIMALYTRAPAYPPEALAEGREADVVLEFTISEYGRTRDVTVISSSDSAFNDAAVDALSEFLYAPRLVNGVPVEISGVRTTIRFKLM